MVKQPQHSQSEIAALILSFTASFNLPAYSEVFKNKHECLNSE